MGITDAAHIPLGRFLRLLLAHLLDGKDEEEREELMLQLSEDGSSSDPRIAMMLETGVSFDTQDARDTLAHQKRLGKITDPNQRAKLQNEYLVKRAKRMASHREAQEAAT
jgi:hypothetical protein